MTGGLFEQLIAIGVWATRPHSRFEDAKEGDSPTFIQCGCKGGRLAHIHAVRLRRRVTRPHSSSAAAKEGDSPTFTLCGCEGGRVALIHTLRLRRRASRPHSHIAAAKEGESPSLLSLFALIDDVQKSAVSVEPRFCGQSVGCRAGLTCRTSL